MDVKKLVLGSVFVLSMFAFCGCTEANTTQAVSWKWESTYQLTLRNGEFEYHVDTQTLAVSASSYKGENIISIPSKAREVSDLEVNGGNLSWSYPDLGIDVNVEAISDEHLRFNISSDEDGTFTWPMVAADEYLLPLGEGKYIPSNDPYWADYLNDMEMNTIESLSMGFFATGQGEQGIVYIMENIFDNKMVFKASDGYISFDFVHDFVSINPDRNYGFDIYITANDPASIAKVYRDYVISAGRFRTLEQKAKDNPNVEKLYGAVHMYFWDMSVISEEDVNWNVFKKELQSDELVYIKKFLRENVDGGDEAADILEQMTKQEFVYKYQKTAICQSLSKALMMPDFYDSKSLKGTDTEMADLVFKGVKNLTEAEVIELNRKALYNSVKGAFSSPETWAYDRTLDVIRDIKESGIDRAWIGMDNWEQGFIHPELVKLANDSGYLIAPYDSYHSIHESGKEEWNTAKFDDPSLYDNATIENEDGTKVSGFQGVGRKLNPTLSLPLVDDRINHILDNEIEFNSWFVDCDATGEVYNDYAAGHITTQKEDIDARLERMQHIADDFNMVVGSEGGNDFASQVIAFAHGIELQSFSWMDYDMKSNRDSEYYMGRYYSPEGGVPEKFSKPVPVKEEYLKIFMDPFYKIPLFKLVYNDSVITSYHWDWSTFKVEGEADTRMLYEILYNIPPLYQIDKFEWDKYRDDILEHYEVYSDFSKDVVNLEMTDFSVLSDDRMVQMTEYGGKVKVIANFSKAPFNYGDDVIEPSSLVIYRTDFKQVYAK